MPSIKTRIIRRKLKKDLKNLSKVKKRGEKLTRSDLRDVNKRLKKNVKRKTSKYSSK